MLTPASRRLAALIMAIILGILVTPTSAHAAPVPTGPFAIELQKYGQPATPGGAAPGLPLDPGALPATDPVAGATFTAIRVPGVDVTTTAGQQAAGTLTATEAATMIPAGTVSAAEATTDFAGDATLGGLDAGLYLVSETVTPAGFIGAEPFLVILPLTNPVSRDDWLQTVHVYPKNESIGARTVLRVRDEDVWACQEPVEWTPVAPIPSSPSIGGYVIQNLLAPGLALAGKIDDVAVGVTDVALTADVDYRLRSVLIDGRESFEVAFTAIGRQKLVQARAGDPDARVTVGYRTTVTDDAPGEYTNEMRLLASADATDGPGTTNTFTSTATVKFGALLVIIAEEDEPANRIPGVTVQLFRTAQDAAERVDPIEYAGSAPGMSDSNGEVLIPCLRLSNFQNGVELAPDDRRVRDYWVALTRVPGGWQGPSRAFPIHVLSSSIQDPAIIEVRLTRARSGGGDGQGGLAITGGQFLGILILGAALLSAGVALVIARRRKPRES